MMKPVRLSAKPTGGGWTACWKRTGRPEPKRKRASDVPALQALLAQFQLLRVSYHAGGGQVKTTYSATILASSAAALAMLWALMWD